MYQNVKRMCRAIVFAPSTYCFVALSLSSPSSLLKLPGVKYKADTSLGRTPGAIAGPVGVLRASKSFSPVPLPSDESKRSGQLFYYYFSPRNVSTQMIREELRRITF